MVFPLIRVGRRHVAQTARGGEDEEFGRVVGRVVVLDLDIRELLFEDGEVGGGHLAHLGVGTVEDEGEGAAGAGVVPVTVHGGRVPGRFRCTLW